MEDFAAIGTVFFDCDRVICPLMGVYFVDRSNPPTDVTVWNFTQRTNSNHKNTSVSLTAMVLMGLGYTEQSAHVVATDLIGDEDNRACNAPSQLHLYAYVRNLENELWTAIDIRAVSDERWVSADRCEGWRTGVYG